LSAYNARDFGFPYLYLDVVRSERVLPARPSREASLIRQMIHCGNSCGYPGSCCNNMSPDQPELRIEVSRLPAQAHFRLWRAKPASVADDADFTFVIEMR
jgi:hypothetical protein